MNTAMTNVLLAKMAFQTQRNPSSPIAIFKKTSEDMLTLVLEKVEKILSKAEMSELKGIADSYRQILKVV